MILIDFNVKFKVSFDVVKALGPLFHYVASIMGR
jgi:hypothetical protein